jgi:hypothetical protein
MPLPPVSSRSFRARHANLGWANLAEGRLRLDRLLQRRPSDFLPLPGHPAQDAGTRPTAFRAEDKKASGLPSSAALRPFGLRLGCSSITPGRSIAIAVAIGAARQETGE